MEDIEAVKSKLAEYRDYNKMIKKIVINIKEEKYNNAIKILKQIKGNEPKGDTPLKKVIPICIAKIN